jgi:poly(3-hydroxybutyrate) depolymerase
MIALSRLLLVLVVSASIICAQRGGTASRGGSLRLEKPVSVHRQNLQTLAVLYRPIVRLLDLNFTELVEEYEAARKHNQRLKFQTVITAYVATEQHSFSSGIDYGKKVVDALKSSRNDLALALQRVFSLTGDQAKSQAHEAVERYNEAERQARPAVAH